MESMQLNNEVKKINDEISALSKSKSDIEKVLPDKTLELQNLLANQALGKNQEKIEPLRQEIANLEKELKNSIDTLAGLITQKNRTEQAIKDSANNRLTQELRDLDIEALSRLKEKLVLLQKTIGLESQIEKTYQEIQGKKAELTSLGGQYSAGLDSLPMNLWSIKIDELVKEFLPLDDQGLEEEISRIDRIINEVTNG